MGLKLRQSVFDDVVESAAIICGVPRDKVLGRNRSRKFLRPRQAVAYVLRNMGYSSTQIGLMMDRDHATVLSAVDLIGNLISRGDPVMEVVAKLSFMVSHVPEYEAQRIARRKQKVLDYRARLRFARGPLAGMDIIGLSST